MKKIALGLGFVFLLFLIGSPLYSEAQTSVFGCCYSLRSPDVSCTYINRNNCANYITETQPIELFPEFSPNTQCSAIVPQCNLGCCCSSSFNGIAPSAQCSAREGSFVPSITDHIQCRNQCNVPQCSDGIDNDGN